MKWWKFGKPDTQRSARDQVKKLHVRLTVYEPEYKAKYAMIGLQESDLQWLKWLQPLVRDRSEQLVQIFYKTILQVDELRNLIEQHSTIDKLQRTLQQHLVELFSGSVDDDFIAKRLKIAKIHYEIGLGPAWYMAAFQNIRYELQTMLFEEMEYRHDLQEIISAADKMMSFEQQLVLEAYDQETNRELNKQFEEGKNNLKQKMLEVSEGLVSLAEQTQSSVEMLSAVGEIVRETTEESNVQAIRAKRHVEEGHGRFRELANSIVYMENFVSRMNETMKQLGESSDRILEVINVVQNVADQTNLLALNSAIEAARAGEHGKGFSVVSQEVRKLADQTKRSASEIKRLIQTSNQHKDQVISHLDEVKAAMVNGIENSERTTHSFTQIVSSMDRSSEIVVHVRQQTEELIRVVLEIQTATAEVTRSAEILNDAAVYG